jgi:WD40 repeat protein
MPQEAVLTASSLPDSPALIHDLHTANLLQTFRTAPSAPNGVTPTPSLSHFLACSPEKGVVNVFSWGRDTPSSKFILPDKVRTLTMSPSGIWIVGGSESGRVFLWEV